MNKSKLIATAAFALMSALPAMAQKELVHTYPHAFVGVQGGAQAVLNGYDLTKVVTPIGAVHGGVWISPSFGVRLHANGWMSKEGVKNIGDYKFNYAAASLDLLFNLSALVTGTDDNRVDVIALGGLGANKAWGTNYRALPNYTTGNNHPEAFLTSEVHNHVAMQQRLGLQLGFNLSPAWAITLEGQANHIGRRSYAHEFNGAADWQLAALAGLTFNFGAEKRVVQVVPAPAPVVPEPAPAPVPAPAPAPAPKPAPAPAPKLLETKKTEIFYLLAKSDATQEEAAKIAQIASWMQAHPTATAEVKGYADKNTGNPTINARYARQRANKVAEALRKLGVDDSRLKVSSYGDTVQPFAENDLNRCVIVVAAEQ